MAKKEIESPSTSLDYLHWWEDNSKPQQPHTFGNILSAIRQGIGSSYEMVDVDRNLNSLWEEYNLDPNVTPERKAEIENLFVQEYAKAKELAKQQSDNIDWLRKDDSKLAQLGSHVFSAGTSLNSMATQYGMNALGAGIGGVVGAVGAGATTGGTGALAGAKAGAKAGWDIAAIPSSIYANYMDAEDAAKAVRERVMLETGDVNLAQQAYEEARIPNLLNVAPSVAADAMMSRGAMRGVGAILGKSAKVGKAANRMAEMIEAAQKSRLAQGLQKAANSPIGTAIGRAANTLDDLDIAQRAGSWVAGKTGLPLAGKTVRGGIALGSEVGSEMFQEGEQGVSEDIAFENAMHKYDPTKYAPSEGWTANKIGNWLNSKEGRETMLDTALSTLLTGGASTALGGFARLNDGYNNKYNLRNIDNLSVEMGEGGILSNIKPETLSQMKNAIGSAYGMNDEQTAALSQEQVMRLWLEDASERAQKQKGMNAEEASTYAVNDFINNATGFVGRSDYTSETSEAYFDKYKIQKTEGLVDKATRQREEQKAMEAAPATAKESHSGTIVDDTTPYTQKREQQNSGEQTIQPRQTSNNLQSIVTNLLPDGQVWTVENTTATDNEYAEGTVIVKNNKTNKVVRVDRSPDGKSLFVADITPLETVDENNKPVQVGNGRGVNSRRVEGQVQKFTTDAKGYQNLGKFFLDNQDNTKTLKQESDEQAQQVAPPDPNRRRVMVNGVHDLANFYRQNSDLMDRDTFMLTVKGMMAYGNGKVSLDLDLEHKNGNVIGEVSTDEIQDGVSKAIIHLYAGADAITVLHEFAHVGYNMMSKHEQQLFNRMAEISQENFVASMLRQVYPFFANMEDKDIIELVRQAVQSRDGNVWKQINDVGVLRQTIDILNGQQDSAQHQIACEERYAWEFTMWYVEGYTKGQKPTNRMQSMLNQTCGTLGKALELIGTVAERLQSDGWQAISNKSMVSMFEDMDTRRFETGNPNVQRMYGVYGTPQRQEQVQEEQQAQQEQTPVDISQEIAEQYRGRPTPPEQLSLFDENGEVQQDLWGQPEQQTLIDVPNMVNTRRNEQRKEQDAIKQNQRMQPVYLERLNKLVNQDGNVTRDEVQMVMSLSDRNYQAYANKVLAKTYPNEERLQLLFQIDQQRGNNFADRIQKKMQTLQTKEDRNRQNRIKRENDKEVSRYISQGKQTQSKNLKKVSTENKSGGNVLSQNMMKAPVVPQLRQEIESGIQQIVKELEQASLEGKKSYDNYLKEWKHEFENNYIFKEAMKRFKSKETRMQNANNEKLQNVLYRAGLNSVEESERTEDGYSVYRTVSNPPSVVDSLRQDAEEVRQEKERQYIAENEDKVQDKYKKLMDRYEKGGIEAVNSTMGSPAIKKDPVFWREAYNRVLNDTKEREEQKRAEQNKKFEDDVQKVVGLLNEKKKKGDKSLKGFISRYSQKFKEDPVYVEAKKRFDGNGQQEESKVQPKVQQEKQVQPASQNVQKEEAGESAPVVESTKETAQAEKVETKEETTNGKTEDSGGVENLRGTEGEVQEGRDNGVSTNQRPNVRRDGRHSVERDEAGNGESVSLLKDKKGKPIGRKIEKVNNGRESKDTKRVIEAAYEGKMPLPIDGFVDITGSKNADGDTGVNIFNKIFGTNYDSGNVVVHRSGKSGYVIDDDGNCIISIAKNQKGLLTNTALIARLDGRVNYIYAHEIESSMISAYKSVGFEPVARIKHDGKDTIVFKKTDQTIDQLIEGFKSKGQKRVKVDSIPTFNSIEDFERTGEVVAESSNKEEISQEKRIEINTDLGEAVAMFPATSDEVLQEVISEADKKLNARNINSDTKYRLKTMKRAAQEELENRKSGVELDEEGMIPQGKEDVFEDKVVLNTVSDPVNLFEERQERIKDGEKDTTTAKEILEKSGIQKEEKTEQREQVQEKVEEKVVENIAKKETEEEDDLQEGEPHSVEEFFDYFGEMADYLDEGSEDKAANTLLDKIKNDTAKLSSEQTEEDKDKIKDRIMKNMKKFNEMIKDYQEKVAQEELDDAKENAYTAEKEVTPQLPQKLAKEVDLTKFDPDNSHRIVISTLTTDGKVHKGIAEEDAVSITEVQDFIRYLHDKYDRNNKNINIDIVVMDEEDKKKLGSIYRKLSRQKNLVQERLKSGVFGTKYTKTNPNSIYSHARAYLTEISSANRDRGGLNLIGTLKQIMNTNLVYEYKYGFDEIDQNKKVTKQRLDKARKNITNLRGKVEALQEQRRNAKTRTERRACTRKINDLVNKLKEEQILLWAHGTDFRGNNKYQDEAADWSLGRWKAYERKLQRMVNRTGEFKEIKKWRSNRKRAVAEAERIAKSTPNIDKGVTVDRSMEGGYVNWNKTIDKHGATVAPVLQGELKKAEDLMKLKSIQELADMSRKGQDVNGILKKLNTLISAAVKHTQISKEQGQEWKQRIKDYTKALNAELAKPVETPKSTSKSTQKQTKETTKVTTKTPQKSSAETKTLSADKFKEITDGMFSMLDKNEKALRNTTVEKLVEFLEKGGYTLTTRQRKSIENKLGMRQERLKEKDNKTETATKQNKPNKSTTEKNPVQKAREQEEQSRKENVQKQLDKLNNSKDVKNWIKGKVTKASDIISKLRNEKELKKIFDKGAEYREGIDKAFKQIYEVIGALENLHEITKQERKQILDKMESINANVIERSEKNETEDIEEIVKNHQPLTPNKQVSDYLNKKIEDAKTDDERLDALIEYNKHFFNLNRLSKEKELRKKLNRPKQNKNQMRNGIEATAQTNKEVQQVFKDAKNAKEQDGYVLVPANPVPKKLNGQDFTKEEIKSIEKILTEGNKGMTINLKQAYDVQEYLISFQDRYKKNKKEQEKYEKERDEFCIKHYGHPYDGLKEKTAEQMALVNQIFGTQSQKTATKTKQNKPKGVKINEKNYNTAVKLAKENGVISAPSLEMFHGIERSEADAILDRMADEGIITKGGIGEARRLVTENEKNTRHMETDTIPETRVEEERDVHSITFTKDALKQSKTNRDRAKEYENNDKYWKKTRNPDGSITFTRKKPEPWHTKAVTYSGINGRQVQKKPLNSISEGLQRAWGWYKEKWLNEQTAIKDLAEEVGAPDAWMEFVVQKDMGSLSTTAIERGIIKHNSKTKERTAALMDFVNEFKDEQDQLDWLDYCEAKRIVNDLAPKGIEQKMTKDTAEKIINKVKNSANAKRYEEWRKKFIEYNMELLYVLVDGNIITEETYQRLCKEHPNFIPLSKDMSDFDEAMSFMSSHKDLLNVKSPLHRIGTSLKEVKNPLLEMQKRTMDYYQRAAQNKAALTFIDKIVTKITKMANGDEVLLNQAILHKLAPQYTKKGTIKDISDPNKGIFYVMRDGKKVFYQLSDASVYKALRSLSYEHMGGFEKFINFIASKPAQIVRTLATITFDFAIGNLYRDAGEAFMTSRHGYIPLYDSFWGMWQMYNDTEWFKEYNSQMGDMTSRIKENNRIAGVGESVEDKLMRIPVIGQIARAMSTFNEYMEQGTRIGEYKNARMGYEGTLGRLNGDSANLSKAKNSKEYAAYRAKDITLNFLQHGAYGKKVNRVTPFFNAALQGQYKIVNTIDEMLHNKEGMRKEMLLKAALIAYLSFMTGWNGAGDDDYEEAPSWERDNYTIRGDGSRTPKDQVLGKLIGNPFEQLGYYAKKGKLKDSAFRTFANELEGLLLPDNITPAIINLYVGLKGGHDTFKGKQIVPEYMKDNLGYLQKDLSTSNFAADLSKFAYDYFGVDVSAKKLDWTLNQFLSNTGKYWNKVWDIGRAEYTGEKNDRTGHMYMEEDSKGAADYLNFTTGNNIIDGTLDLARMAFGKKFIQNQTTFNSLQDFNEEYLRLKKLKSDPERMTKEEEKLFKTVYEPAYKNIRDNQKKLSEIGRDKSLDRNQKLVKARPIILKSVREARDAEKAAEKLNKK